MRKAILPVLVVIACLGLAACGGSSGSSSTTSSGGSQTSGGASAFSPAAFRTQLSGICRRANAAYNKAPTQAKQVGVIQHYLGVFRALRAPKELDSAYALYLAVLAKELRDLKKGDAAGLAKVRDTQAGPLVRQLGATGCYG
jgi:predicted small secreted protein